MYSFVGKSLFLQAICIVSSGKPSFTGGVYSFVGFYNRSYINRRLKLYNKIMFVNIYLRLNYTAIIIWAHNEDIVLRELLFFKSQTLQRAHT